MTARHTQKRTVTAVIAAAAAASALSAAAHAGIIEATFHQQYGKTVNITTPVYHSGNAHNVHTVTFNWTRTDPGGPGYDHRVNPEFTTYCIDLEQTVSPNKPYTFEVLTLDQAGYSAAQTTMLGRLWAAYQPSVSNANSSAAFQLAVWELTYDTDNSRNLSAGAFVANSPNNVKSIAQGWLDSLSDTEWAGGFTHLVALRSATAQDQLTAVPNPGAASIASIAGLILLRRRRR